MKEIEENVIHRMTMVEDKVEGVVDAPEELRDSWLEKNVAAEGEVTILRERVDQQDQKIKQLEEGLADALQILLDLRTTLDPGRFFSLL